MIDGYVERDICRMMLSMLQYPCVSVEYTVPIGGTFHWKDNNQDWYLKNVVAQDASIRWKHNLSRYYIGGADKILVILLTDLPA